jgi:hypothetical protein
MCALIVWGLMYLVLRGIQNLSILRIFWDPLKILVLAAGPLSYPLVIWGVFRYQLPPMMPEDIRKNWRLWIPGFIRNPQSAEGHNAKMFGGLPRGTPG